MKTWKRLISLRRIFSTNSVARDPPKDVSFGGIPGLGRDILNRLLETMFTRLVLGLRVMPSDPGALRVHLPLYDFRQAAGTQNKTTTINRMIVGDESANVVHTGVLATVIDHCGGLCAWTMLTSPSQLVSTVDLQIDYLLPVSVEYWKPEVNFGHDTVYCEALAVSITEKFILCDIAVYDSESKRIKYACGRGLYNIYYSPLTKLLRVPFISTALLEKFTSIMPSKLTAFTVRTIENLVVLRLRLFPHRYEDAGLLPTDIDKDSDGLKKVLTANTLRGTNISLLKQLRWKGRYQFNGHIFSEMSRKIRTNTFIRELFDLRLAYVSIFDLTDSINQRKRKVEQMTRELMGQLGKKRARDSNSDNSNSEVETEVTDPPISSPCRVVVVLPFKKRFIGNFFIPCVHGGVSASLLEYTGYLCAIASLQKQRKLAAQQTYDPPSRLQGPEDDLHSREESVTNNVLTDILKVSYLKPTPCQHLICEAVVSAHITSEAGEECVFVDMEIFDSTHTIKLSAGSAMYRLAK